MDPSPNQATDWWFPADASRPSRPALPFYTFLLKVASRCNLDCDYCYVYRSPDQSWRARPHFMEPAVANDTIRRIAEHVAAHQLEEVDVVFHGGEPLLAGPERLDLLAGLVRAGVPAKVNLAVQTNGTLLTPQILDVLERHQIRVGMSLDGPVANNDRHRLDHGGRSSHKAVLNALDLIRSQPRWERLFGGFLAVIDLRNDPVELYRYFVSIRARSIDLLLPDFNHDRPPLRLAQGYHPAIAYGQWLGRFFEAWFDDGSSLEIKYFEEILSLMLGGPSCSESIGLTPVDLVVIETDGAIEPVDTLKTASRTATNLGMNVRTHSFDQALCHPAIESRLMGAETLCETCRACPELSNCGGGYVPHRFREANGFLNPSIYCADLKFLFATIRQRIQPAALPHVSNLVCHDP